MPDPSPILELTGVTVEVDPSYDSAIWNVNLRLMPGELALVRLERGHMRLPLADVAEGLIDPQEGTVRFLNDEWRRLFPSEAARRRGHIGRVFEGFGWISNLDVDENVMLARRHHGGRKTSEWVSEASTLARTFGLPGLPKGRPAHIRAQDLQRAACVRAFLGKPDLIILERPEMGVYPEIMRPLMYTLRTARAGGAAVLWLTSENGVWNDPGVKPTYRYVMSGSRMLHVTGDDAVAEPPADQANAHPES